MLRAFSRKFSLLADFAKQGIKVSKPVGNYVSINRAGNMLYLSGALPIKPDGSFYKGKVGADVDEKTGYEAARRSAMTLAANILSEVGDVNRVKITKITGFVNCTPDFEKIPAIVNGASDLLVEIFGEHGKHISLNNVNNFSFLNKHARSAVGVNSLPMGVPVEVEAIVEILNSSVCCEQEGVRLEGHSSSSASFSAHQARSRCRLSWK